MNAVTFKKLIGSLTVCDGVSFSGIGLGFLPGFPHYT